MQKVEILAPCGNFSMLEAGLSAQASSFYLALDNFGARAYAENFTLDNIGQIIDYIHLFDKKVFITINTLIKDSEIKTAVHYIEELYKKGADAILIQDIGLYNCIKDKINGLSLHASTQMAVRDYYGVKTLIKLGFDRAVIARETSYEEIQKIVKLPIETEVFVHGSLCVSFSGECLMSSFLGKRSANRGRCAGICRKKYKLIADKKVLSDDYYLSMNDLNTIKEVSKLVEIGVDSLKIEGRMKSPEYVYTIVKNYKDMIENHKYSENELLDITNRAYTKGFIFGQNREYINLENSQKRRIVGNVRKENESKYFLSNTNLTKGTILQIITEKNKKLPFTLRKDYTKDEKIYLNNYSDAKIGENVLLLNSKSLKNNLENALKTYKNLPVNIEFFAQIGQKPKINIFYKNLKVTYEKDEILEKSKKISIKNENIIENLSRFNDEVFKVKNINLFMDDDVFIRKKVINECRREAISLLINKITKAYHRKPIKINFMENKEKIQRKREHNIELLDNNINQQRLKKYDNIYIREYDKKFEGLSLYFILDSKEDYKINELIKFLKENSIKGVIFNNYRDLNFIDDFRKNNIKIRIGRYLNVFNKYAHDFYKDISEMVTASVETTFESINEIAKFYPVEVLNFGPIELMTMLHCPFSHYKKCGLKGCKSCKFNNAFLKDEEGNEFKVIRYNNYSKIYSMEYANVDKNLLDKNVSFLSLISSQKDLDRLENDNKINNLNYQRGVV